MDSKETMYLVIAGIVLLAIIFWFTQQPEPSPPVIPEEPDVQKDLFLQALKVGRDATTYLYTYSENVNGFIFDTHLINNGVQRSAIFDSPVAHEQIFFADNITVYCVRSKEYNSSLSCAQVQNVSEMQGFILAIESTFFDPTLIDQIVEHNEHLLDRNVIQFKGSPIEKTVNGNTCTQINYRYDHTQLTLADLSELGISPESLSSYDAQWCITENGEVYEKTFSYTYGGKQRYSTFTLLEADWSYDDPIELPELENKEIAPLLFNWVREHQGTLQSCYLKEESLKERCISTFAIEHNFADVCDTAGTRRDVCYVSLALYNKDENICPFIHDTGAKDDCYIEVAGQTQRSELCDMVQDSSKLDFCLNASQTPLPERVFPEPEEDETPANETSEIDPEEAAIIDDLLEQLG